jgi:hypothetical protein
MNSIKSMAVYYKDRAYCEGTQKKEAFLSFKQIYNEELNINYHLINLHHRYSLDEIEDQVDMICPVLADLEGLKPM